MVPDEVLDGLAPERSAASWRSALERTDATAVFVAVGGARRGAFCRICPVRHPECDGHRSCRPVSSLSSTLTRRRGAPRAGHAVHDAGIAHVAEVGFRRRPVSAQVNELTRSFYTRHGWSDDGVRRAAQPRHTE